MSVLLYICCLFSLRGCFWKLEEIHKLIIRSDSRHKSRFSHVNVFLRHYGGQLKTTVEKRATVKDNSKVKKKYEFENTTILSSI